MSLMPGVIHTKLVCHSEKSTFPAIKYNSGNIFKTSKNNVNKDNRMNDTKPKSTAI